jgi:acylphosphatase
VAEEVRARIRITGVVQGVGYRYFVRNTATALGLAGYVRNRSDGSVEIVVEGPRPAVNGFIGELRIGPRFASVEGMDVAWEDPQQDFRGFDYAF